MLQALAKLAPQPVQIRWATNAVMQETGIRLPLVRQPYFKGTGSLHFDGATAQAAGLLYRPLADTAAATLAWQRTMDFFNKYLRG